jgi:hypothetical protein
MVKNERRDLRAATGWRRLLQKGLLLFVEHPQDILSIGIYGIKCGVVNGELK